MPDSKLIAAWEQHRSVSTDTRKIQPGDLFFALKGDNFNGNKFAAAALESGASYAIVDEDEFLVEGDDRYILVPNVLQALQDLGRHYRDQFGIPFIGITGTNGKTTTKELMHAVLSTEKRVHATVGNFNNHIGVPLTLLSMPEDTEIAIIEMGANKHGDIKELSEIANPTHGMITNIGRAHLERFGDIDGVERTKGELFRHIEAHDAVAWVNIDDERVARAAKGVKTQKTYGNNGDYDMSGLWLEADRIDMTVRFPDGGQNTFRSQLIGRHNAENMLAAVVAGWEMGISIEGISKGMVEYVPKINRTQRIVTPQFDILLDAYNANPSSMEATISSVASQKYPQPALILGDMFELGDDGLKMHSDLLSFVRRNLPDATLIAVGELMAEAMQAWMNRPAHWHAYKTVAEAAENLQNDLKGAKFVLLKGSRGMALEKLLPELGAAPTEAH